MRAAKDRRGPRADSGAVNLLDPSTPRLLLVRDRPAANRNRTSGRTSAADVSRGPGPRTLQGPDGAESAFGGWRAIADLALAGLAASPRLVAIGAAPLMRTPRDAR